MLDHMPLSNDENVSLHFPKWMAILFIYGSLIAGGGVVGYWIKGAVNSAEVSTARKDGYTAGRASCIEPSRAEKVVTGASHWLLGRGD